MFANSSDPDERWEVLRGLPGVQVFVERMDPDAERDGLTKSMLHTTVEMSLRAAGVRVLSEDERLDTPRAACLYVHVGTSKNLAGFYAYAVEVVLMEVVSLHSIPAMEAFASTWQADGATGTVGSTHLRRARNDVLCFVDEFIKDYLRANPKN